MPATPALVDNDANGSVDTDDLTDDEAMLIVVCCHRPDDAGDADVDVTTVTVSSANTPAVTDSADGHDDDPGADALGGQIGPAGRRPAAGDHADLFDRGHQQRQRDRAVRGAHGPDPDLHDLCRRLRGDDPGIDHRDGSGHGGHRNAGRIRRHRDGHVPGDDRLTRVRSDDRLVKQGAGRLPPGAPRPVDRQERFGSAPRMRGVGPTNLAACALLSIALVVVCAQPPPAGAATPPGVEIVNVATSSYFAEEGEGGLDPPGLHEVTSNPVITRVIAVDCFAPPLLQVEPAGTVAPGTALDYLLTAGEPERPSRWPTSSWYCRCTPACWPRSPTPMGSLRRTMGAGCPARPPTIRWRTA